MDELKRMLERYIGGHLEAADMQDSYIARGPIKSIELVNLNPPTAKIELSWVAFYDREADEWHLGNRLMYLILLETFSLFHGDRLYVQMENEGICLALPGDIMIEPSQVVDFVYPDAPK